MLKKSTNRPGLDAEHGVAHAGAALLLLGFGQALTGVRMAGQ